MTLAPIFGWARAEADAAGEEAEELQCNIYQALSISFRYWLCSQTSGSQSKEGRETAKSLGQEQLLCSTNLPNYILLTAVTFTVYESQSWWAGVDSQAGTEGLMELFVRKSQTLSVLDIGTGSRAIALALTKQPSRLYDLSKDTLIAAENAQFARTQPHSCQSDCLDAIQRKIWHYRLQSLYFRRR